MGDYYYNDVSNPYASLVDLDDDDEDEYDSSFSDSVDENKMDGGAADGVYWNANGIMVPTPPLYTVSHHKGGGGVAVGPNTTMSIRRLLIRIVTSQSEIHTALAGQSVAHHQVGNSNKYGSNKGSYGRGQRQKQLTQQFQKWTHGATHLTYSLERIREALLLAETEISRWIGHGQMANHELMEDADIVQVSIGTLTYKLDTYKKATAMLEAKLAHQAAQQRERREQIKERMGHRWFNNPKPRMNHANVLSAVELKLEDTREAMAKLEGIETTKLQESHDLLMTKIDNPTSRYNGKRPAEGIRVSLVEYPDPASEEFMWVFTGSDDAARVEFFETETQDGDVKLDWYFATATVKTSFTHPTQGKTNLFAGTVNPKTYRQIMKNPRHASYCQIMMNPRSTKTMKK